MSMIINEQKFIEDNIDKVRDRMTSQLNRFTDKKTTFVKYFHVNNTESMADDGFQNVNRVLGKTSPIRFSSINNFPLLGLETINLDLSDEDEGLNSSYESEAYLLPGTIEPTPHDFFLINYLGKTLLFEVISFSYDSIKSHNFYRINFHLRSINTDIDSLYNQVTEEYECIYTNIGTEENCIIKKEDYDLISKLDKLYEQVTANYSKYFLNTKYNSFIFRKDSLCQIYDVYLNYFITTNGLFNHKFDIETTYTMVEDQSRDFEIEYDKSFYKCLEKRRRDRIKDCPFYLTLVSDRGSIFNYYRDNTVVSVKMGEKPDSESYIPSKLLDALMHLEEKADEEIRDICKNAVYDLVIKYFTNPDLSIFDLKDIGILEVDLEWIDDNDFEAFRLIPIALYIIRKTCEKYLKLEKSL